MEGGGGPAGSEGRQPARPTEIKLSCRDRNGCIVTWAIPASLQRLHQSDIAISFGPRGVKFYIPGETFVSVNPYNDGSNTQA